MSIEEIYSHITNPYDHNNNNKIFTTFYTKDAIRRLKKQKNELLMLSQKTN